MTLEDYRKAREGKAVTESLLSLERSMWERGWPAVNEHICADSLLGRELRSEKLLGLSAFVRDRSPSPFKAVRLTPLRSTQADTTAVLHYLAVLKHERYRNPQMGSCMSVYRKDATKPSGWCLLSNHVAPISPKRMRAILREFSEPE